MKRWFFAILPPSKISAEVIGFQEELKEQYGFSHALKTPPHLTIIPPFEAKIDQIDSFCMRFQKENFVPYNLQLEGFEAFHPRVIFVDVVPNCQLNAFVRQTKKIFAEEKIKANRGDKHSFTPHITIANRDLNNKMFKKVFPTFKTRKYNASFTVDSLYLLMHNEGHWKQLREIKF